MREHEEMKELRGRLACEKERADGLARESADRLAKLKTATAERVAVEKELADVREALARQERAGAAKYVDELRQLRGLLAAAVRDKRELEKQIETMKSFAGARFRRLGRPPMKAGEK